MDERNRFLIVSLEGESFALAISNLVEITVPRAVQKDPKLSAVFEGTMEFRGNTIPVADLKKILTIPGRPGASLLVMKNAKGTMGLLVDTAVALLTAAEAPSQMPRGLLRGSQKTYAGLLRTADTLVPLLDVEGLLE
jgi:purine-binding chemotaxis protein CheW